MLFFALNVGGLGVVTPEGQWVGEYVYAGPSVTVPVHGMLSAIPGVSCEVDPVHGNWGCGANVTADILLSKRVALDLTVSLTSDTDATGRTTAFFAGGPSITCLVPVKDSAIGISVGAQPSVGLRGEGWSLLVPVVNVSVPLSLHSQ